MSHMPLHFAIAAATSIGIQKIIKIFAFAINFVDNYDDP